MRRTSIEESGLGNIVKGAIEAKAEIISEALASERKQRSAVAAVAPSFDIQSMLALAQAGGVTATASGQVPTEASKEADLEDSGDCSADSDDESSSDHAGDATQRLASWSRTTASGQGSAGASGSDRVRAAPKAAQEASARQASAKPKQGKSPRGKVQEDGQGAATAPGQGTFTLDGRSARLVSSVEACCQEVLAKLADVRFNETHEGSCIRGDAIVKFQAALTKKARILAQLRGQLKTMQYRVERSKGYSGTALGEAVACKEMARCCSRTPASRNS